MLLFSCPQTLQCSNHDIVSAATPEHLDKSELLEIPVEQKDEDVSGAESTLSEAASDAVGLKDIYF